MSSYAVYFYTVRAQISDRMHVSHCIVCGK